MKSLLHSMVFSIMLMTSLSAQDLPKNTLSLKAAWINYQSPNNDHKNLLSDLNRAIEIGYNRHFNNLVSLSIPVRIGYAEFPVYNETLNKVTGYTRNSLYTGADALLNLHLGRGKSVSPFAYGGVGYAMRNGDDGYAHAPFGLGLDIKLTDFVNLVAQGDYRYAFKDGFDSYQYAIGARVCLCGKEKDRDKDGVADKNDLCPDEPGTINGCPDGDGDGIADKDDKCPSVAGVSENMGCPADRDKDGVYDVDDRCPDAPGSLKGCPDTDKDGLADVDDECPNLAGTIKGCPDSDKDGVADKNDRCPNVAGPASNNGCPNDRDKDGVEDAKDSCPDLFGTINGCPDSDADGLTDNVDKCPKTAGPASNNGCPEIKVQDKKTLEVAMRSVQFETGTAKIAAASNKNLNDIVKVLNSYPEMMLSIEGHTDNVGDPAKNMALSESRAKACMDYLVSKGIKADRLMSKGYGDSKPLGDNKTAEGRKTNRRTEFVPVWR